jgi:hypothetical protein
LRLFRCGTGLQPDNRFRGVGDIRMPWQTKVVQALRYHFCLAPGIAVEG